MTVMLLCYLYLFNKRIKSAQVDCARSCLVTLMILKSFNVHLLNLLQANLYCDKNK